MSDHCRISCALLCENSLFHLNYALKSENIYIFAAKYYVTLLRAEDESKDPIVCRPVLKNVNPATLDNTSSPLDPKLHVKACAGPMSPDQVVLCSSYILL